MLDDLEAKGVEFFELAIGNSDAGRLAWPMQSPHHENRELSGDAVWQKAMDLVVECYRLSDALPRSELFGLAAQIRRSACSVPANGADEVGRKNRGD